MSDLFFILAVLVMLTIPVLLIVLIVRALMKKPIKKPGIATLICVGSIIPLAIIGAILDPATWCDHDYEIIEEIPATCLEEGEIHKHCPLCGDEDIEYVDKLDHLWEVTEEIAPSCTEQGEIIRKCASCGLDDIKYDSMTEHSWVIDSTVKVTCTESGYTVERCNACSSTRQINNTSALGHNMKEVTRVDPTYDITGKIVKKCDRCDHEETETLEKLEPIVIKFNGLELTFKGYSFTTVDNKYSEHYGKTIVRIPVTVKNISNSPNSLNRFDYTLFCTNGIESADVGYFFDDDMSGGGELLSGKSYTKYIHIVYDGDGVYTIVFDNWLFDKETIEIYVKK